MAEEKNDLEYQNDAYVEVKKSRLQAFKDLFKRQEALPESSATKHKTTNMSIETTMSLREFRRNLVEKVGSFFQALSKIGAPKKDESPNKFAKEYIGSTNIEKSAEKTRNDDDTVIAQQPRYFPGDVAIKAAHEPTNHGTVIIAETTAEHDLGNEIEGENRIDSSIDTGRIDLDEDFKDNNKTVAVESHGITAGTMNVAQHPEVSQNLEQKPKNIIIPGSVGKSPKTTDEKDGPEL